MSDKTLQDRLREHRVILKSGEYDGAQLMAAWCDMVNTADALDAQAERIKALEGDVTNRQAALIVTQSKRIVELEGALRGLSDMYTHAWDTVSGDLLMMSGSIPKFETAHKRARALLGE